MPYHWTLLPASKMHLFFKIMSLLLEDEVWAKGVWVYHHVYSDLSIVTELLLEPGLGLNTQVGYSHVEGRIPPFSLTQLTPYFHTCTWASTALWTHPFVYQVPSKATLTSHVLANFFSQ